jgi:hypothetical protein
VPRQLGSERVKLVSYRISKKLKNRISTPLQPGTVVGFILRREPADETQRKTYEVTRFGIGRIPTGADGGHQTTAAAGTDALQPVVGASPATPGVGASGLRFGNRLKAAKNRLVQLCNSRGKRFQRQGAQLEPTIELLVDSTSRVLTDAEIEELLLPHLGVAEKIKELEKLCGEKEKNAWLKSLQTLPVTKLTPRYPEAAFETVLLLDLLAERRAEPFRDLLKRVESCRNKFANVLYQALPKVEIRRAQASRHHWTDYPRESAQVAGTSIGNVLRAVDSYGHELYGLDTELVLPRLQPVMEKEGLERLRTARERLELLEWSCIGVITIGIVGTIIAALGGRALLALLIWTLAFPIAWWVLHPALFSAALGYAQELRAVLDRDRGRVLEALGLSLPSPTTQEQERLLWERVGRWWDDGTAPDAYRVRIVSSKPKNAASDGKDRIAWGKDADGFDGHKQESAARS